MSSVSWLVHANHVNLCDVWNFWTLKTSFIILFQDETAKKYDASTELFKDMMKSYVPGGALLGMFKWPFQMLSGLQLGDQKVTLNHLVVDVCFIANNCCGEVMCTPHSAMWICYFHGIVPRPRRCDGLDLSLVAGDLPVVSCMASKRLRTTVARNSCYIVLTTLWFWGLWRSLAPHFVGK